MKLNTYNDFEQLINQDFAWRKKDITKAILDYKAVKSEKDKDYYWKVTILVLYSFWEGFIKSSSLLYLQYIKNKNLCYRDLNYNLRILGLREIHKTMLNSDTKRYCNFQKFEKELLTLDSKKFNINEQKIIDTDSNLKYEILHEILNILNIPKNDFELKKNLIDTILLANRNAITHGDKLIGSNKIYDIVELRDKIFELLEIFKTELLNSIALESYLASKSTVKISC